jgi:hypothetical protein
MDCEMCEALLADYDRHVDVYTKAILNIREVVKADSTLMFQDGEGLKLACKDAREALMGHLRRDHRSPTARSASS